MRIGQFCDTFLPVVDGVGRVVVSYAETLSGMGHQVTVVTPINDTGFRGALPYEVVDYMAAPVPTAPQYKAGAAVFDPHYQKRLHMVPLDIIHAHSPFTAGIEAQRIAHARGIPLVSTFHSKYYDDFYKATKSGMTASLGVRVVVEHYNRCDEVWAVSDATAETLRGYGYTGPIRVMPNGVSIRTPAPDAAEAAKAYFGLDDRPLLLFIGQMNWKKNILRILESCALLRQRGVSFQLLLAGQGPDEEEIKEKVKALGLEGQTTMPGHVRSLALLDGLYQNASLFLFPSIYDNAPMVVREAAVAGTASLLAEGSSAAQVVQSGVNGLTCPDNSVAMADTLYKALLDPPFLRSLGEKARETIPVPWETILTTVTERYKELIAHKEWEARKALKLDTE